ncbi:MAG TPA: PIN domain-containing protein [Candidatus Eisenbacteria bacterium]|nr:PIN domain-containing protein [Candidatus Eisenbacteria bacterium]
MIGVDTSVVVRYLVGTPEAEARRAAKLIDGGVQLGLSLVVLVETAHVLRTQYGIERADVLETLIELLSRENVVLLGLSNADALAALVRARALPRSPIPDALIAAAARAAGAVPIYTFDEDLHRHGIPVAGFETEVESDPDRAPKLGAIRKAAGHSFPTGDIEEMLGDIERGVEGLPDS